MISRDIDESKDATGRSRDSSKLTSVIPWMAEHDGRCRIEFLNVQYQVDKLEDVEGHRARGNEQRREY